MIAAQRRNIIVETIERDGAVSITALSERLKTSAVTIRRDLDQLADEGRLVRTHGGALLASSARESSYAEKLEQALAEKTAIARAAAKRVRNGDVVALGPGTTTELLAKELVTRSGLRVVTNSLLVAEAMVSAPENEVIVVGGTLRHSIRAFVGGGTVAQLLGLRADTAFLSGNGLAADFGLSTPAFPVADTDRAMATGAGRVIALVDHTKIGRRSSVLTVPTDDIQHLITDSKSEKKQLDALREAGVEVDAV
ncbi:DeoR/GlpR family DNA-binding transcription regulator [Brevibacterium sp. SMBL_HHYL_HB1]|uniref:DeoR/GlpR family DNA-binding transcription regulator n=1 Tax=Brevibacterium sp. SMBL_HHYL_HB1 TaxID=2777556 RepID=UPI001BA6F715|nr:DeoR/GlpR family DNA-binding transcription regulator [Brevibacterium sp. SMBL_HHYL_HB1]QUL80001.1 DeoR/GlpR transcriptional regulator [Brevibacterium sp. SMBL_HHYL_HB1]